MKAINDFINESNENVDDSVELNENMKANVKLLGKDAFLDDSKPKAKDWTVTALEKNSAMPKGKTVPFIQVTGLVKVDGQDITQHKDWIDRIFK